MWWCAMRVVMCVQYWWGLFSRFAVRLAFERFLRELESVPVPTRTIPIEEHQQKKREEQQIEKERKARLTNCVNLERKIAALKREMQA